MRPTAPGPTAPAKARPGRVRAGDAVFSPRLAGFVLDAFSDQAGPEEVALRLDISAKTVEAHVSAVLRKLQPSNRHELSRWAMQHRLVDPD